MKKILNKFSTAKTSKELFEKPKLEFAFIRINNICNAKCAFCDVWKSIDNFNPEIKWQSIMSDLIDLNPQEINFHGGEAFLSRGFYKILEMGEGKLKYSVTTNGFCLNETQIHRMYQSGIKRLYISIDHYDPTINSISRGIPSLKNNLFPGIKLIKKHYPEIEIVINHVVSNRNFDTIENFFEIMKSLGTDCINLIPMKDYPEYFLTIKQIQTYNEFVTKMIDAGMLEPTFLFGGIWKIFGEEKDWYNSSLGQYIGNGKKACLVPSGVLFLDAVSADIYPCDTTMYRENPQQYILGNVLKQSLKEIWEGNLAKSFRDRMFPKITCDCIKGCDPNNFFKTKE
jgi:MoaA/NifB/PqqE/SkfB family radical SAM enzyme